MVCLHVCLLSCLIKNFPDVLLYSEKLKRKLNCPAVYYGLNSSTFSTQSFVVFTISAEEEDFFMVGGTLISLFLSKKQHINFLVAFFVSADFLVP